MSIRAKKIILFIGDITVFILSLWLALLFRYGDVPTSELWDKHFPVFAFLYIIWAVVFYIVGLYSIHQVRTSLPFYSKLSAAQIVNAFIGAIYFYILLPFTGISPKTLYVLDIFLATLLIVFWRKIFISILDIKTLRANTLLIAEDDEAKDILEVTSKNPHLGYSIVKVIRSSDVIMKGSSINLKDIVEKYNIKVICVEPAILKSQTLTDQLFEILPYKIKVVDLASLTEEITGKIPITTIGRSWFLDNLNLHSTQVYEKVKRIFDIVVSVLCLILLSWLFPLIAAAIVITSGRPVFFKQKRVGYLGRVFTAVKFRTMVQDAEKSGPQWAQKNDPRITKIGKFLRKTRLDELPQLINVLRGEMSLVGPRPERPEFVARLKEKIPFYNERHLVKPGLTGWAQINFPYGASEEDSLKKLQYDLYYIKNRSFIFDIAILLKTAKTILSGEGQ